MSQHKRRRAFSSRAALYPLHVGNVRGEVGSQNSDKRGVLLSQHQELQRTLPPAEISPTNSERPQIILNLFLVVPYFLSYSAASIVLFTAVLCFASFLWYSFGLFAANLHFPIF